LFGYWKIERHAWLLLADGRMLSCPTIGPYPSTLRTEHWDIRNGMFYWLVPESGMGGLGGAASAVGKLLGFGQTIANPDECLKNVEPITALCPPKFRRAFALPNQQLPETIEELRDYLFHHSLTTDEWPWNGLSFEENRELVLCRCLFSVY
jgi:hypothetical protein